MRNDPIGEFVLAFAVSLTFFAFWIGAGFALAAWVTP